ncbi:MAG: AraC family transcriptional regulator [Chakrabartia sp.]
MLGVVDHDLINLCERNPLADHAHFASRDLDEARSYVGGFFCNHQLSLVNRRTGLDTVFDHVRIGSVGLVQMGYGADVLVTPGALEDFYLVQIPISGHAAIRFGREEFFTTVGIASVQHPEDHLEMRWSADCRKVVVRVDRARFERFIERCTGRPQRQSLRLAPKMDMGTPESRLMQEQVKSALHCATLFRPGQLPAMVTTHVENAVMGALLCLLPHDRTAEFARLSDSGEGPIVSRVREYLEAHAEEPIGMEDLVDIAGVPLRTLYHVFRQTLGISPMQLLRDIRLDRVRHALSTGRQGISVTMVALDWGFHHLGRFAQQYRARFGETPSETLRRSQPLSLS